MIKLFLLLLIIVMIPIFFVLVLFANSFFKGYNKINND